MSAQGNGGGCKKCSETQKRINAIERMMMEMREAIARLEKAQTPQNHVFFSQPAEYIDFSSVRELESK